MKALKLIIAMLLGLGLAALVCGCEERPPRPIVQTRLVYVPYPVPRIWFWAHPYLSAPYRPYPYPYTYPLENPELHP